MLWLKKCNNKILEQLKELYCRVEVVVNQTSWFVYRYLLKWKADVKWSQPKVEYYSLPLFECDCGKVSIVLTGWDVSKGETKKS